ncbi:MAG: hypothetical protein RL748_1237 [Pseudomonadota bacterium]|jgi:hypothetical protein
MSETKPYIKTFEDELDWKLLDQLHGVVSQISSFCFETKKFCVTIQFVVITLLAKFTKDQIADSLFVVGLLIPLCFWFLDAIAYYYQVKIRGSMELISIRLKTRNIPSLVISTEPDIDESKHLIAGGRGTRKWYRRVFDALINHSMWIYGLMISLDGILWLLFWKGIIR